MKNPFLLLAETESTSNWVTLAITFLGGAGGLWIINFFKELWQAKLSTNQQNSQANLAKQQQVDAAKITENEQAFTIIKEVVSTLRDQMKHMTDDMQKMEENNVTYREKMAAQAVQIDNLIAINKANVEEIMKLRAEIAVLRLQIPCQVPVKG